MHRSVFVIRKCPDIFTGKCRDDRLIGCFRSFSQSNGLDEAVDAVLHLEQHDAAQIKDIWRPAVQPPSKGPFGFTLVTVEALTAKGTH